jgi:protein-S-isoprenylcysteine O-methyltransferase Ste14
MKSLENRIPPPLVAALFGLAMWVLSLVAPGIGLDPALRLALSLLALLLGVLIGLMGIASFQRARTTTNPLRPETATKLVSSGIYRFTRNPMYLGVACLLVSLAVWLAFPWSLLGVLGFVLYMNHFQIAPEERALAALFGEEFERYRGRVRRWL